MSTVKYNTEEYKTLGELVSANYADYEVLYGSAPLDSDLTHGVEIEVSDNRKFGHGVTVSIYPFVEWSDGCYKPCHYWGRQHYLVLYHR